MNTTPEPAKDSKSFILWAVACALWVLTVAGEALWKVVIWGHCETSLDSIFGTAGWSWLPLGPTCTWNAGEPPFTATSTPSWTTVLPPVFLVLWWFSLRTSRKNADRKHPADCAQRKR